VGLQLEPGRADRDALLQADQWLAEGADTLMLQPVMGAVDGWAGSRAAAASCPTRRWS
jgi:porphobilinogen synthase